MCLHSYSLGLNGMLRWNLLSNEKERVHNDSAILVKPGILLSSNRGDEFAFGGGSSSAGFAWRLGAGAAFWGVLGRD